GRQSGSGRHPSSRHIPLFRTWHERPSPDNGELFAARPSRGLRYGALDRQGSEPQAKKDLWMESLGVNPELAFRHLERFLSRGRPRGLFAPDDRGTGKLSAESFDKLPPRQLTMSESWRYSQFNCF